MKKIKLTSGREAYYAEDVDKEIARLKKALGGKVENLKPREPKYDEFIQRQIAERVVRGESKRSLSNEYGVSRATIGRYCKAFEDEAREREARGVLNAQEAVRAVELYSEGKSISEIAERLRKDASPVRIEITEKFGKKSFCVECAGDRGFYQKQKGSPWACVTCGKHEVVAPPLQQENDLMDLEDLEDLGGMGEPRGRTTLQDMLGRAEKPVASVEGPRIDEGFRVRD